MVSLPWAQARALQITSGRRRDLEQALPYSDLAGTVAGLSRRRGGELPAGQWDMGPHGNSSTSASYSITITAPDGGLAVTAAAMIALPHTMESNVVVCTEILIEDTAAWAAALPAGADTRLDLDEIQAALLAAWQTAAELLPNAVGDPSVMRWAAPPTIELRLSAESLPGMGLARPRRTDRPQSARPHRPGPAPEMAVTVTAPPLMERRERQSLLRHALARMTGQFGHVQAAEELL